MLQIIKKIIIVLAAIVIIDRVFTYAFTNYIFKKTISGESGGTINYVINKKKDLDFLIIGASRAKHSIDPKVLTSLGTDGYNLGINGTDVLNSLFILDILVRNGVKPKTLIVQTDLSDYVSDTDSKTLDQMKRVYPYGTPLIEEYVRRMGVVEEAKYFFGLYRFNRKILNISFNFVKRNSVPNNSGYVGLPNMDYKSEAVSLSKDYAYNSSSLSAEAIKRIKKICDENNIKLIVVLPPSYKNVLYNEAGQKKMDEDLKKDGINNIIDLSDIDKLPELSGYENWRDAIHPNYLGSQKFSHILNEEIIKLSKNR